MKITGIVLGLLLSFSNLGAQNKYWVTFSDKSGSVFDATTYFDAVAIQHLPINTSDSTDFPLNSEYVKSVSALADSVSWQSRWLNGMAVYAGDESIKNISSLPFVLNIEVMDRHSVYCSVDKKMNQSLKESDMPLLMFQTKRMQGDTFNIYHLNGSGIRIAVFDVGFPGADKHPAFAHLRKNNQIIDTYDFVSNTKDVYKSHWHGTATLSCLAGITDSVKMGLATGAEYLLARTEKIIGEPFSEEENWLAAAEWAYQHGANIISSSLGYTYQRYFNTQMNGRTSLVSRAATIAASKGILVVNAAGNEGNDSWHFIDTPGDADSVLTVGGTDPETDAHIFFSSFGPTSDGRLKPNVCALGEAIVARSKGYAKESGTSFSAPLVAGFAACAWQAHRQWTNMELFDAIEKSSSLYPYFDYAHGFGIPQAGNIISGRQSIEPTFDFVIINNDIKIILREQYSYTETENSLGYASRRNFFYKVEDKNGTMKSYTVLLAEKKEMLHVFAEDFQAGDVLTVQFEGYTNTLDFPGQNK